MHDHNLHHQITPNTTFSLYTLKGLPMDSYVLNWRVKEIINRKYWVSQGIFTVIPINMVCFCLDIWNIFIWGGGGRCYTTRNIYWLQITIYCKDY